MSDKLLGFPIVPDDAMAAIGREIDAAYLRLVDLVPCSSCGVWRLDKERHVCMPDPCRDGTCSTCFPEKG